MNTMISILNSFYNCSLLPVKAIDIKFSDLYSVGYNKELTDLFNNLSVTSKIKLNLKSFNKTILNLDYDINYSIVPMSKFDNDKGYYILGPFRLSNDSECSYNHISYREIDCVAYLSNLLINISNDKYSKGRINLNFNTHVRKSVEYCIKNYDSFISIESICKELNINKSYFCKIFKEETGHTFTSFLNIFRVEKSKQLLRKTQMSLLDIAISVGFNSQNYYTIVFKKITNQTPMQYRNEFKYFSY